MEPRGSKMEWFASRQYTFDVGAIGGLAGEGMKAADDTLEASGFDATNPEGTYRAAAPLNADESLLLQYRNLLKGSLSRQDTLQLPCSFAEYKPSICAGWQHKPLCNVA
jgi:hypothetical protein